ncbi:MAG: peptidase C69 [Promethearchaeota archaeon]|nr:MAG: peptidase C69 [Candidatus Lokiarchaeota archaeon]
MCDTLVALGNSTEDNSVIFGKNSDRPHDEVQLITYLPRRTYSKGEQIKCSYISIPQVTETAAVLMSQPWWMWGAEMGVNEYGVAIGNEAVYTHEPLRKKGLLGMDLLRLGIERGKTARDALNVIINLLEEYHQGGGCAFNDSNWIYHNSYIIADSKEAYVLETADDWWIVEKIINVRSISNGISIRGKGDIRRKGIIQHAIDNDYCKDDNDFDFAVTFTGSAIYDNPSPYTRGGKSIIMLQEKIGEISPELMMDFLREHDAGICMHGSFESTGSQISNLRKNFKKSIHWFSGSTLPCLSIYKPYIFPIDGQKFFKQAPYSNINPNWFWVRHKSSITSYKDWSKKSDKEEYIKKLRTIEKEIISNVKDIVQKEKELSFQEFIDNFKSINLTAWEKSEQLTKV